MASPDIEPVSRESTAAIIARQLRNAIMTGALRPGAQLGEADLAARFQVSRGPLREAMQRLVSEGLLRSERHRGLFVIDLEPGDVYDIYASRAAIERSAAIRIMRGDTDGAVAALREVLDQMRDAAQRGDENAVSEADLRFHETLVRVSGSRRLVRMAQTLLIETRMCLAELQRTDPSAEDRVAEHTAIIDAITSGEEDRLLELLDAHLEDAVARLAPGTSLYAHDVPAVPKDGLDIPG